MPTLQLINSGNSSDTNIVTGSFGDNISIALDSGEMRVVLMVIHGAAAWEQLDDPNDGFNLIISWMVDVGYEVPGSKTDSEALLQIFKKFFDKFWFASPESSKKRFLGGVAKFLDHEELTDDDYVEWKEAIDEQFSLIPGHYSENSEHLLYDAERNIDELWDEIFATLEEPITK